MGSVMVWDWRWDWRWQDGGVESEVERVAKIDYYYHYYYYWTQYSGCGRKLP